jgi:hypothetical protein
MLDRQQYWEGQLCEDIFFGLMSLCNPPFSRDDPKGRRLVAAQNQKQLEEKQAEVDTWAQFGNQSTQNL